MSPSLSRKSIASLPDHIFKPAMDKAISLFEKSSFHNKEKTIDILNYYNKAKEKYRDIFNDPKAPNPIKIDSILYNYVNRKLQIFLPVTTTDFEYFRMIADDGNIIDTLSIDIFENNGLSVLSVDNYEPDQNQVFNTYVCN